MRHCCNMNHVLHCIHCAMSTSWIKCGFRHVGLQRKDFNSLFVTAFLLQVTGRNLSGFYCAVLHFAVLQFCCAILKMYRAYCARLHCSELN
jgi:hypothetical protein